MAHARLHTIAFFGGLLILVLGVAGWAFGGGPESIEDIVLVLDLTIGGTLLATGALVGRARAAEARRNAQLEVLQHAARRMSLSLSPEGVGRAVVEETQRVIDYHNARVYLLEPPDDLVPIAFEGRVGAYEHGRHGDPPDDDRRSGSRAGSRGTARRSASTTRT